MGWLGTWKSRRKITIDNTNVDAALSNFPMLVHISASSGTESADITDVFTRLGADANRKKIAITTDDGETQCYVEIERFDYANLVAWFWVKVPSVASGSVTNLYIYYDPAQADNTVYIGDTTDAVTHNVWDANFVAVFHMAQDPNGDVADSIKDSTSNQNDGTPSGSMTSADLVDGKIGKAIDFDGSDDYIAVAGTVIAGLSECTIELIAKWLGTQDTGSSYIDGAITGRQKNNAYSNALFGLSTTSPTTAKLLWAPFSANDAYTAATIVGDDVWRYVVAQNTSSGQKIFLDGVSDYENAIIGSFNSDTVTKFTIGAAIDDLSSYSTTNICEKRISNLKRSPAWIKATYYSSWDGLVLYGDIEWFDVIDLTAPLSVETSIRSDIAITVPQAQLSSESSMSVGSLFAGIPFDCPSPLVATSSLQADAEVSIPSVSLAVQSEVQSDIQVSLPSALLSAQSDISIGNILLGYIVNLIEALLAQSGLQVRPQIGLTAAQFTATSGLSLTPERQLFLDPLIATASLSATPEAPFTIEGHPRVYLFTLTGEADGVDDVIIPISSFQSRIKSGDPTFLSVVIPSAEYASYINNRPNGDLVIRMGYKDGDEILLTEIIAQVTFENIAIYEGATNKSITLDGHKTETWIPKEVDLTKASYMNLTDGKLRYRCKPDLYLRPGDTVNINDDTFVVNSITFSVSSGLETYEVAE